MKKYIDSQDWFIEQRKKLNEAFMTTTDEQEKFKLAKEHYRQKINDPIIRDRLGQAKLLIFINRVAAFLMWCENCLRNDSFDNKRAKHRSKVALVWFEKCNQLESILNVTKYRFYIHKQGKNNV